MDDSEKKTENNEEIQPSEPQQDGQDAPTETTDAAPQPDADAPVVIDQSDLIEDAEIVEDAEAEAEVEPEAEADPEPILMPEPTPAAKSGGGFIATALGGVVAAAIGFGAAQVIGVDLMGDNGASEQISAQASQLATLTTRIKDLEARPAAPDLSGDIAALKSSISAEVGSVSDAVDDLGAQVSALADRLSALEARPPVAIGGDPAAAAAYEKELATMRAELDAQRTENQQLADKVASAAADATAEIDAATANARALESNAAMMRIKAALETGGAYADALAVFDGADIPAPLAAAASTGAPTLSELQASYPAAARTALSESLKSEMGDSATERLGAFLRSQVGARSLNPREGDDPDAILSRAEAALRSGDLAQSLAELASLPPAGQTAMADWATAAQTRLDVLAAADAFAASQNLN